MDSPANRKSTRLIIKKDVLINDAVKGYVLDINEDAAGMFIHTHIPFPMGSIVNLHFTLNPGEPPYNVKAEIKHVKPAAGVGVLFLNVSPEETARIKAFLDTQEKAAVDTRKQILIVDDSATVRLMFTNILVLMGYAVREAPDGRQALAIIKERIPDLILLDLLMEGIDGFQVLEILRADERTKDARVVILSAAPSGDVLKKLAPFGVLDFLPKMITTPKKLGEKVEAYLSR